MMIFGERVKEERIKRKITQKEAADHLHMSESTLSRFESGKRVPSMEEMKQFSDYYEIPMQELIDETESVIATDSPAETMQQNIVDAFFESKNGQIIFYMIIIAIAVVTASSSAFSVLFAIYGLYYACKSKLSKGVVILNIIFVALIVIGILEVYFGMHIWPYSLGYTDVN